MLGYLTLLLAAQASEGGMISAESQCDGNYFNGQLFDTHFVERENTPELSVMNATSSDAIVRLQDLKSPQSATIFVESGKQATIKSIPEGQYEVRVAYNGVMGSDCLELATASQTVRLDELQAFEIVTTRTTTRDGVYEETSWTVGELKLTERIVRRRSAGAGPDKAISIAEFNSQ